MKKSINNFKKIILNIMLVFLSHSMDIYSMKHTPLKHPINSQKNKSPNEKNPRDRTPNKKITQTQKKRKEHKKGNTQKSNIESKYIALKSYVNNKQLDIAKILLLQIIKKNNQLQDLLNMACNDQDFLVVEFLLQNCDVGTITNIETLYAILNLFIINNKDNNASTILDKINLNEEQQQLFLNIACNNHNLPVVEFLLKELCDNHDFFGVEFLLQNYGVGIITNIETLYDVLALYIECDEHEKAHVILQKKGDINQKYSSEQISILHEACKYANLSVVEFLLKQEKINVLIKDTNQQNILHYICESKGILHHCSRKNWYTIIEMLLKKDPSLKSEKDIYGMLPIQIFLSGLAKKCVNGNLSIQPNKKQFEIMKLLNFQDPQASQDANNNKKIEIIAQEYLNNNSLSNIIETYFTGFFLPVIFKKNQYEFFLQNYNKVIQEFLFQEKIREEILPSEREKISENDIKNINYSTTIKFFDYKKKLKAQLIILLHLYSQLSVYNDTIESDFFGRDSMNLKSIIESFYEVETCQDDNVGMFSKVAWNITEMLDFIAQTNDELTNQIQLEENLRLNELLICKTYDKLGFLLLIPIYNENEDKTF
jgi:hypothetical protein